MSWYRDVPELSSKSNANRFRDEAVPRYSTSIQNDSPF